MYDIVNIERFRSCPSVFKPVSMQEHGLETCIRVKYVSSIQNHWIIGSNCNILFRQQNPTDSPQGGAIHIFTNIYYIFTNIYFIFANIYFIFAHIYSYVNKHLFICIDKHILIIYKYIFIYIHKQLFIYLQTRGHKEVICREE